MAFVVVGHAKIAQCFAERHLLRLRPRIVAVATWRGLPSPDWFDRHADPRLRRFGGSTDLARPPDGGETPAIDSFNKPPGVLNEYSTVLATRTLKATSPEHDVIADKKTRARKFRYEFTELPSDTQIIGRTGAVRPSTEAQKCQPHTTSYVGASVGALIESTEPLLPQTWTGSLQQDALTGNEHNAAGDQN
ncbi:hypothetical protein [Mycobacterium sp.]|uniref:hypothetical protein n=1 Tax=Mycobacterium sp. TaxID=1785 RepID=UPI003BA950CF